MEVRVGSVLGGQAQECLPYPVGLVESLTPACYSLGDSIIPALGKNPILCIVQAGKEREEESNVGLPPHPGVKQAVY